MRRALEIIFTFLVLVTCCAAEGDSDNETYIAVPKACDGVTTEMRFPDVRTEYFSTLADLPTPDAIHGFIDSVEGLEIELLKHDGLFRDTFYVRLHVLGLDELAKQYDSFDPQLLKRAKVQACLDSLRGSERSP